MIALKPAVENYQIMIVVGLIEGSKSFVVSTAFLSGAYTPGHVEVFGLVLLTSTLLCASKNFVPPSLSHHFE